MIQTEKRQELLISQIKAKGLKLTSARQAILRVLGEGHRVLSAEEIQSEIKDLGKSCDLATVYRNLFAFEKIGLIGAVDLGDGVLRYERVEDGHRHHHVICESCGKIQALEVCPVLPEISSQIEALGYRNVTHRLEFFGICQSCSKDD